MKTRLYNIGLVTVPAILATLLMAPTVVAQDNETDANKAATTESAEAVAKPTSAKPTSNGDDVADGKAGAPKEAAAPEAAAATNETAAPEGTPEKAAAKTEDAAEPTKSAEKSKTEVRTPSEKPFAAAAGAMEIKKAKPAAAGQVSDDGAAEAAEKKKQAPKGAVLGLAPGVPEISTLPGGLSPAFGAAEGGSSAWKFNFHGLIYVPLRFGIGEREHAGANQKKTVFHAPPRVPGDFETFGYTSTVANPWTQLNFSYGNNAVIANVVIAARTVSNANGYFNPPDMLGINDAYITMLGNPSDKLALQLNMGAFANRYGNMGEFDLGRFNTPIIARVSGTGITGTGIYQLNETTTLMAEVGYHGQFAKAPVGVEPAGWNGFADPNVGSSYAAHGHAGVNFNQKAEIGVHVIRAFTRDDRAEVETVPDGAITIGAADLRLTLSRFGHLYTGMAYTKAKSVGAVSNVVRILNAPGGKGLINEYLGQDSDGNGALTTLGLQYDLSLGNLLRHPSAFEGNAPDLLFSLFTIYTHVKSDDSAMNGIDKMKLGGELSYLTAKWLTLGARYDIVMNELGEHARNHDIITGRLVFHSDWNSRDQIALQYSHFRTGEQVAVREGYPPADDLTIVPDSHVISLTASMWW